VESLTKSLALGDSGVAYNGFFLAMAHWQLGHPDESRDWYDKAVRWMTDNKSTDNELLRFQAEAEQTLGIDAETSTQGTSDGPSDQAIAPAEKDSRADPPASSDSP
jgi:hypothetical protein